MRMATETITVYLQQKDETYVRQVIKGVSWSDKTAITTPDKEVKLTRMVAVRIPEEATPEDFGICPDDLLVKGICEVEIGPGMPVSKFRRQYDAVTVQAVHDNRRGICPHWKAEAV